MLGANQEMEMILQSEPMDQSAMTLMKSPGWALFLIGRVSYTDIFKKAHKFEFLERVQWRSSGPVTHPADRHNERE